MYLTSTLSAAPCARAVRDLQFDNMVDNGNEYITRKYCSWFLAHADADADADDERSPDECPPSQLPVLRPLPLPHLVLCLLVDN